DGVGQGDVGARDRRRPRPAVGLEDIAVDLDGVLAQRAVVDDRAQRPADQPGDLVGAAADAALDRLPVGAGVGRRGEHRVLRRHPPETGALAPARHALGGRGGTQDAGPAELDQHRAGRVIEPVPGEADRAQFVVGAAVLPGSRTGGGARGLGHGPDPTGAPPPPRRCGYFGSDFRTRQVPTAIGTTIQISEVVANWAHASASIPPVTSWPVLGSMPSRRDWAVARSIHGAASRSHEISETSTFHTIGITKNTTIATAEFRNSRPNPRPCRMPRPCNRPKLAKSEAVMPSQAPGASLITVASAASPI